MKRRASSLILVSVCVIVLLSFASLTIDVGAIYITRNDLQRSADSGALAGASVFTSDDMLRFKNGTESFENIAISSLFYSNRIVKKNLSFGLNTLIISPEDTSFGVLNPFSQDEINPIFDRNNLNTFKIFVKRDNVQNNKLQLFFAGIFGKTDTSISAMAAASFNDAFLGIDTLIPGGANLLPFTIHENIFNDQLTNGQDNYSYLDDYITQSSDDIPEVKLFPYPLSGSEDGSGNFGYLNIGNTNQSANTEQIQITEGISPDEIESSFGTNQLLFNGQTYPVNGSPGLTASSEDEISSRIGDIVGFFLHNQVILNGSNAIYTITGIRYGRIMAVNLNGSLNTKHFYIQPVIYGGNDVILDPSAPSSEGLIGQLVLSK